MLVVLLSTIMPTAFASFTLSGSADEHKKNSKYSLNNINKYAKKSFNPNALRNSLHATGNMVYSFNTGTTVVNGNALKFSKGNTTYILPYNIKLKAPKFKTPTALN